MAYIFTIIFISKLVLNLCKNFCAIIAWYQKPTYSVISTRPELTRIFVPEDQPDVTQIWTLVVQPDPKSDSIEFIKYITGLNPILNPFWGQPDPIQPIFCPWGPDLTLSSGQPENRVGFGHTRKLTLAEAVYFFVGNSGRNFWRIPLLLEKIPTRKIWKTPKLLLYKRK